MKLIKEGPSGPFLFYLFIVMEYSWHQFIQLDKVRNLPLNEQVREYNFYLESLSEQINRQNKGDGPFLLLESGNYILLENGNRILLDGLR